MDNKQLEQEFIQFLGEQLLAKDLKDLELKVSKLSQEELTKYYKAFAQHKKRKAEHGAKLNYFKKLKNICAEDEELQYFKKGGSVDCGCVKKAQQGTTAPKKNQTVVEKFKNRTKEEQKKIDKLSEEDYFNGTADHTKPGQSPKPKKKENNIPIKTPKTPKKKKGGNLNEISFMEGGTTKGGVKTAPRAEDRYANGYYYPNGKTFWNASGYIFGNEPLKFIWSNNSLYYTNRDVLRVTNPSVLRTLVGRDPDIILAVGTNPSGLKDTVYIENPPVYGPVQLKSRIGASYDTDRTNFEIMKKRFNTAVEVSSKKAK